MSKIFQNFQILNYNNERIEELNKNLKKLK